MITYEDPEAHDDVYAPINDEWIGALNLEEPDTIIDIQALLDEVEEKHLPGKHDQKTHGHGDDDGNPNIPDPEVVARLEQEYGIKVTPEVIGWAKENRDTYVKQQQWWISRGEPAEEHHPGTIESHIEDQLRRLKADEEKKKTNTPTLTTYYHGTVSSNLDDILKNGLKKDFVGRVTGEVAKYAGPAVFVSKSKNDAFSFAYQAASDEGTTPVVFLVRVPKSELNHMSLDTLDNDDGMAGHFKLDIDIPASWIKKVFRYQAGGGGDDDEEWEEIKSGAEEDVYIVLRFPADVDERIDEMGNIKESLGYKALVAKFGLPEAERRLTLFQEKNMVAGQQLEVVAPGMNDVVALLTRQNELITQLMSRGSQPQVVINNQLDPEPLARAIRDAGAPFVEVHVPETVVNVSVPEQLAPTVNVNVPEQVVNVHVPEQAAPVVEVHPVIAMPETRTETIQSVVTRDADGKLKGTTSVKTTEFKKEVLDG